jgi:DNA-binding HxlR family transcriptional regulator
MAKRSYQQFCGLAAALDVVGERWAMLVVRDLVPGPRRFKDLFDGLPGIATDMLADRLRSLEAAGAVEQVTLRHPAPAKVYALTDRGHELARIGADLAGWGMALLPSVPDDAHRTNPRWALQTMTRSYAGGLDDGEYRWTIDDEQLSVVVGGGDDEPTATVAYGHGDSRPVLEVRCPADVFFALVGRGRIGRRLEIVIGTGELLTAFVAAMPLPARGAVPARAAG